MGWPESHQKSSRRRFENARIIAHRAKQKDSATAATQISLKGVPTTNLETLKQLIQKIQRDSAGANMTKLRMEAERHEKIFGGQAKPRGQDKEKASS
jgi:hypothetical protein